MAQLRALEAEGAVVVVRYWEDSGLVRLRNPQGTRQCDLFTTTGAVLLRGRVMVARGLAVALDALRPQEEEVGAV
jgi:hypothetical protein